VEKFWDLGSLPTVPRYLLGPPRQQGTTSLIGLVGEPQTLTNHPRLF